MAVRKFRDVSEMEGNTWRRPGDPELFRAMRDLWEFSDRLLRPHFPPGVYKHRSLEEAEAQRERWEEANFRAYRARLSGSREALTTGASQQDQPAEDG